MITRLRIVALLARPSVIFLLALFTTVGQVHAAGGERPAALMRSLLVVAAYLVFSVAVNDIADVAIDRVNLPGDRRRPLASGLASARDMVVIAVVAALTAVIASVMLLDGPAAVIVLAGLAVSLAYSLPPARIAQRGAVASLVLPAAYVVVPYSLGVLAVRSSLRIADALLIGGLYVGFVGRILLKDFRDVHGDALFGKRTFLVRHGRRATCAMSAGFWAAGTVMLAAVRPHPALVSALLALLTVAFVLLRHLSIDRGPRRDERLVSALAIVGRGMIVVLLVHLSMDGAQWAALAQVAVLLGLAAVVLGQARHMASVGPRTRTVVPPEWLADDDAATQEAPPRPVATPQSMPWSRA